MLTHFQIRKLTRYFNCMDADGNGYIEKTDVDMIVKRLAMARDISSGTEAYKTIQENIGMIWDNARVYGYSKDPNKVSLADWLHHQDIVLSTEEWREKYMKKVGRSVFDLIDSDGDGEIDLNGYSQLLSAFGVEEGIPEWSFKYLDTDGNGTITRDEFLTIVEQFHISQDREDPGNYLFGPY